MKFCKNCNKGHPDDNDFCPKCGSKLTKMIEEVEKEVPSKTPTEPIKKSSNLIKFAVILGAILLLGTFALAYTGKVITPTCGDGNCLSILGENCRNCQVDCGTCTGVTTTTTSIRTTIPRTTITTTIPGTTVSTTTIFQDNVDVSVLNKNTHNPISNVDVYLDNLGIKCTTNQMGTCSFYATPENHLFKLRGEGIQFEEVRKVTEAENDYTFYVERKYDIQVLVKNKNTNLPVQNAEVFVDGYNKGKTSSNNVIDIADVNEGSHTIQAKYQSYTSEIKQISVSASQKNFWIEIDLPQIVTFHLKDSGTSNDIGGEALYFDNSKKGLTSQSGQITVGDVSNGIHRISLIEIDPKLSQDVNIQNENTKEVVFDMPNPDLKLVVTKDDVWFCPMPCTRVDVHVTVRNLGDWDAKNVFAIVSVYDVDNNGNPTNVYSGNAPSQATLTFPNIPKGEERTLTAEKVDRAIEKSQKIIVVLFDSYKYSPEKDVTSNIGSDKSMAVKVLEDAKDYCSKNIQQCVDIVVKVVGAAAL